MTNIPDISGRTFGLLTVIDFAFSKNGHSHWNCICECGQKCIAKASNIKARRKSSCGCLYRSKNGMSAKHPSEFDVWRKMIYRCTVPKYQGYYLYGGRGITVSKEWIDSFEKFINDMGVRPSREHTIERIDNSKGYSKENCKWATMVEQSRNKRNNVFLEHEGEKLCIRDWSIRKSISERTIKERIKKGWSIERVLNTPADKKYARKSK